MPISHAQATSTLFVFFLPSAASGMGHRQF
jgi:hypothetical protein